MSVAHGKRICIDRTRIAAGSVVRIKTKEWYETNKDINGQVKCGREMFVPNMQQFLGKDVTVSYVAPAGDMFDIRESDFWFTPEMVEFIWPASRIPSAYYEYTI